MKTLASILFCLLLAGMLYAQGISALLWVPVGFVLGLFVTAQIVLPVLFGLPRAIGLVRKRRMRAAVFGRIIMTSVIWVLGTFVLFLSLGWFLPSFASALYHNLAFNLALWLGTIAIILSPLSKSSRSDFKQDFENAYSRYFLVSPRRRQVEAALKVASNLYCHTIQVYENEPATLLFNLPDSRFRYLIFCLSSALTAILAYDEKKVLKRKVLLEDCVGVTITYAQEKPLEFFGSTVVPQNVVDFGRASLQTFINRWSGWAELKMSGKNAEVIALICQLVRTTESDALLSGEDRQRLEGLALKIDDFMPIMRDAFIELCEK